MFDHIRSDIQRYRRYGDKSSILRLYLDNQGLWAMLCYRAGRHRLDHPQPPILKQISAALYYFWWKTIQVTTGIYISPTVRIAKGFYVGHFGQIFIGENTTIGEDCNVAQGVTLGYAFRDGIWGVPHLGDRVFIAAGAKVIGPIRLANGTVVGANAVVTRSTEENDVVAGVPARVLNKTGSKPYIY